MSAQWRTATPLERRIEPMTISRLDAVMEVEVTAYEVPWSRGNFVDSLASAYLASCLFDGSDGLVGYCVAMPGAGLAVQPIRLYQ